ncbi:hypothetical protein F383_29978 [Gossypium arboreum]|uniref:Uncharacterized protein n=1 Tax=Gossypium arboreum TaxID=29729 RepID=A0A0B0PC97_GOSAR|nr:hypothetical protein F383_29978 [Gossypium arboreum]
MCYRKDLARTGNLVISKIERI